MTSAIPWLEGLRKEAVVTAKNSAYIKAQKPTARIYPCAISHERLLALLAIAEAAHHDVFIREYLDGIQSALDKASRVP